MKKLVLLGLIAIFASSCASTRTKIGQDPNGDLTREGTEGEVNTKDLINIEVPAAVSKAQVAKQKTLETSYQKLTATTLSREDAINNLDILGATNQQKTASKNQKGNRYTTYASNDSEPKAGSGSIRFTIANPTKDRILTLVKVGRTGKLNIKIAPGEKTWINAQEDESLVFKIESGDKLWSKTIQLNPANSTDFIKISSKI